MLGVLIGSLESRIKPSGDVLVVPETNLRVEFPIRLGDERSNLLLTFHHYREGRCLDPSHRGEKKSTFF